MELQRLQAETRLIVRQRIRLMVNQYEVHAVQPDGSEGALLAFAQQKRMAFKEQVTLYTDDTKQQPVLGFKARQVIDLGATYDVTDATGDADRPVPQGLRRVAAALHLAPGAARPGADHRPGAQPAGRPAAPVHRLAVLAAVPLRLPHSTAAGLLGGEEVGPARPVRGRGAGTAPGPSAGDRDGGGAGRAAGPLSALTRAAHRALSTGLTHRGGSHLVAGIHSVADGELGQDVRAAARRRDRARWARPGGRRPARTAR